VRPRRLGIEAHLAQPGEQVVEPVGQVVVRREGRERVGGILGDDHVAEHEPPVGGEDLGDAAEEVALALAVEVVDRQARDDEVERPLRERVDELAAAELGALDLDRGEHPRAPVDAHEVRARMPREHAARRLAGAEAELQDARRLDGLGRARGRVLELLVAGDLVVHQLEELLRRELGLVHGTDHTPR